MSQASISLKLDKLSKIEHESFADQYCWNWSDDHFACLHHNVLENTAASLPDQEGKLKFLVLIETGWLKRTLWQDRFHGCPCGVWTLDPDMYGGVGLVYRNAYSLYEQLSDRLFCLGANWDKNKERMQIIFAFLYKSTCFEMKYVGAILLKNIARLIAKSPTNVHLRGHINQ